MMWEFLCGLGGFWKDVAVEAGRMAYSIFGVITGLSALAAAVLGLWVRFANYTTVWEKKALKAAAVVFVGSLVVSLFIAPYRLYRDKVAPASPVQKFNTTDYEVRHKLKILEEQAARQERESWPALTEEQKRLWAESLGGNKIASIELNWAYPVDADNLFKSLREVGKQIGVSVEAVQVPRLREGKGAYIISDARNAAGPIVRDLMSALIQPVSYAASANEYNDRILIYLGEWPGTQGK